MADLVLRPIRKVDGEVTLPGSKSLSNRVLLLSALAEGTTAIKNLLHSDDISYMLQALARLGVCYTLSQDNTVCEMQGVGGDFPLKNAELFLGNAGTAIRPLCAALSASQGMYELDGNARMRERPIEHLVDGLRQVGVHIEYLGNPGYPPLKIFPGQLQGGGITLKGNISSQFLSSILMAAPLAKGQIRINIEGEQVSKPYVDITLHTMERFGVAVEREGYSRFVIEPNQCYVSPGNVFVEGDASGASYFLSAAAIRGGTVRVHGIGRASVQGDVRYADVLEQMGAHVAWGEHWIEVSRGDLLGIDIDMNDLPDAAMTLAVTALFAKGSTAIRNIYNLRVKETDRLTAMATELRKLGATVEEGNDYIVITPPARLIPASIDTYDDHRIAMSFSLAALGDVEVVIKDKECVSKTFPDYFERLERIEHG